MDPRELLKNWSPDQPSTVAQADGAQDGGDSEHEADGGNGSGRIPQAVGGRAAAPRARRRQARPGSQARGLTVSLVKDDKVQRLELLHDLAQQFVSALDLEELMKTIFSRIIEVLEASAGSMWLVDPHKGDLVCEVAEGPEKGKVMGLRIPVGTGVIGWVAQKNKSTIVYDASKDSRFSKAADRRTGFETRSMIAVPLAMGDEILGAVQVINKTDDKLQFTDDDLHLLEQIATYAAISIKNARLYESQRKVKELNALLGLSKEITSTLDLDSVLVTVVNAASQVIAYKRAAVALEDNGRARIQAVSGESRVDMTRQDNRLLADALDFLMNRGKELWVADADAYLQTEDAVPAVVAYLKATGVKALWARPLSDEEGVLGILAMESDQAGFIQGDQAEVLGILANQATVAVRNAQLYKRVPLVGMWQGLGKKGDRWRRTPWYGKFLFLLLVAAVAAVVFVLPNPRTTLGGGFVISPQRQAVLYAGVDGTVERVLKHEGDRVARGEPVVRFDVRDLLLELEAKRLARERARVELVSQASAVNPDPLKRNEYLRLERDIEVLQEKLQRAQVFSPMDGVLLTRALEDLEGQVLKEGDEVAVVADLDRVRVEIDVREADVRYVREGSAVTFKTSAYRDRTLTGSISALSPAAEEKNGTQVFIATVEIDNPRSAAGVLLLKPGMSGRAEIAVEPMTLFQRFLHALGLR